MSDAHFPPLDPPAPRKRWPTVLLVLLVLLLILLVAASRIQLDYFAISPGQAEPVAPHIHVPPGRSHPLHGTLLFTDVYSEQVSLLDLVPDWLDSDTQLVKSDELVAPGIPPAQLTAQGFLEMSQSQDAAKTAALTRLGYHVAPVPSGVLIFGVAAGGPAASVLQVGDVVIAVNGTATPQECDFIAALHPLVPGDVAHLTVRQASIAPDGTVGQGPAVHVAVTMGPAPHDAQPSGCPGVVGPQRAEMGVEIEQQIDYHYPFPVSINLADVGGPSAGLAMTLGIMDELTSGRLTGSTVVAATGAIDPAGDVGQVGGVPQKTVAVERAGATVFIVPVAQFDDARSKATASLHVCRVSTLGQALGVLARYGGHVPASLHPRPVTPGTCT